MWTRCTLPSCKEYKYYGARGVRGCERWKDFENFYADMGPRPPGYTLDRKDSSGDYEPSNCRWLSLRDQQKNRRDTRLMTLNGETLCIADWARRAGVNKSTVYDRLKRGQTLAQALVAK